MTEHKILDRKIEEIQAELDDHRKHTRRIDIFVSLLNAALTGLIIGMFIYLVRL